MTIKELVSTLPGSLGVNPPEWTTAHKDVPPEWLSQVDHPCMIGGRPGTMQIVDGRLICVVGHPGSQLANKESMKMKPLAFAQSAVNALIEAAGKNTLSDLPIHQQLTHAVTRYDRRREGKRGYNPHALPLYLRAADDTHEDIKKGHSVADAVNNNFNGPLANHIHKMLNTGGKARESVNGEDDMDDVITESVTLRFSCPSRVQLAKVANYFSIGRATGGLGKIIVRPVQGTMGNWYFDVSSNEENQFLNPNHMNNILPAEVTVTRMTGGPVPTTQTASQDETRNIIREMVEKKLKDTTNKCHTF